MQTVAQICAFFVLLGIYHANGTRLNGQLDERMILPFVCNNTNLSSITIHKDNAFNYIIYDVAQKSCANVSNYYTNRIESCVFNGKTLNLTLGQLKWLDKGNYTALDDQGFFLDSIFLDISDNKKSTQQVIYSPMSSRPKERDDIIKSTQEATDSPDCSSHMDENDIIKSTQEATHSPDSSSHMDENAAVWLLGASILLLLMITFLAIVAVWKYRP